MLYGIKLTDKQAMITDESSGKQIVETPQPEVPEGYKADWRWEDTGYQLVQTWELRPLEGTAEESMLALAKMQAAALDDDQAAQVPALYDEWINGESYYGPDDESGNPQSRVRYLGVLYKCLQTHIAQVDWTPTAAPSLWAKVLPGQTGNEPEEGYAEWVRPDSTNGYSTGDKVTWNGHLWESIVDSNVDEPGTDNGFRWKDLGEYPAQE